MRRPPKESCSQNVTLAIREVQRTYSKHGQTVYLRRFRKQEGFAYCSAWQSPTSDWLLGPFSLSLLVILPWRCWSLLVQLQSTGPAAGPGLYWGPWPIRSLFWVVEWEERNLGLAQIGLDVNLTSSPSLRSIHENILTNIFMTSPLFVHLRLNCPCMHTSVCTYAHCRAGDCEVIQKSPLVGETVTVLTKIRWIYFTYNFFALICIFTDYGVQDLQDYIRWAGSFSKRNSP